MSPKTRLSVLIVALVATVVVVLSTLYLYGLTDAKFRDMTEIARISAEQVKTYLLQRIQEYSAGRPSADLEESKQLWRDRVREDSTLASFLIGTIASSGSVVEIQITDEQGIAVAGSNPGRLGDRLAPVRELGDWSRQSAWRKLGDVLAGSQDLELQVPLGVAGEQTPVFTIHVVLSTVLLRDAVVPQVRGLALISLLSVVVAALVAGLLSNLAARPLARVSEMIDSIASGEGGDQLPPATRDPELASLQSKLSLLGAQIRGAAADASALRGNVEQMLERLEDAVLLFSGDNKLIIAGRAAERYLGRGRWDMLGHTLDELFEDSTPLGALVRSSAARRRPLRNHLLAWRQSDGSELRALVSLEVMEEFSSRQRLGTIVTLRDAESRRELGSHLDTSYRREAMGRILRGVAHEIKNPLNSIQTHVQLLEMELGDREPELKHEIGIITREIRTLDRMVVTLLDFTKPLELSLTEVDLRELAGEIARLVQPEAAKKGVTVDVQGEAGHAVIQADHALLRQAVMNVVINGIECMHEPGHVRIGVTTEEDCHVLTVADEGHGIADEIREKIFQLYFTTKGRGSGIGLAMTYRVAQLHGASLDFTSREGKGTVFRFRFPVDA